jgi:hypothetical protein
MIIAGTQGKGRARCRISNPNLSSEMNSMKLPIVNAIFLVAGLAVLGPAGCGKDPGPPPPLAAEQIPNEMQKVFNNAGPEAKDTAGRLSAALQSKDYPVAYQEVQVLCTLPDETREQRALAARTLLTITGLLQTAQDQGDERAAVALRVRQMTR